MTYVVVAFVLLTSGQGYFLKSPTYTDRAECDAKAVATMNAAVTQFGSENIKTLAAQCIPNDETHVPAKGET